MTGPFLSRTLSHQVRFGQHMPLHCIDHVSLLRPSFERQLNIQRIKLEVIPVRFPRWWTGAAITDFLAIVSDTGPIIASVVSLSRRDARRRSFLRPTHAEAGVRPCGEITSHSGMSSRHAPERDSCKPGRPGSCVDHASFISSSLNWLSRCCCGLPAQGKGLDDRRTGVT
jgi:hypothetical protein